MEMEQYLELAIGMSAQLRGDKDRIFMMMVDEMAIAKEKVAKMVADSTMAEFDPRAKLYFLSELAEPNARDIDARTMIDWAQPCAGQKVAEIAAGPGKITLAVLPITQNTYYAIDPSGGQLDFLELNLLEKIIMSKQTDSPLSMRLKHLLKRRQQDAGRPWRVRGKVDIVLSFGGLHHMVDQLGVYTQIGRNLNRHGRAIIADIGEGTDLGAYFIEEVTPNCLTGHPNNNFLDIELTKQRLVGQGLELAKCEDIDNWWGPFVHPRDIPMFFTLLHGATNNPVDVINGLQNRLGIKKKPDGYYVRWPMRYIDVRKIG